MRRVSVTARAPEPLFKDLTAPLLLELVDAQTYNTGAALHVYRRAP